MKNEQESFESSYTLLRKKVAEARKVVAAIACTSSENTTPHVVTRSGGRNDEVAEAASFVVFDKTWATPLLVVVDGDGDDVQVVLWGIQEKGGTSMSAIWTHVWKLGEAADYLEYYKNNI